MSLLSKVVTCVFVVLLSVIVNETVLKPRLPRIPAAEQIFSTINSSIRNTDIFSPLLYVTLAIVSFFTYNIYNLLFEPLNRVRNLGDLGYQKDGKFSLKEIANSVKRRRNTGEIPPVYPNGWYALIESWKLKEGETKNIYAIGQELAVFRDENGDAHVLDAYCPHMGANLAVGGIVVGDCIQCPFHGWKFRGQDGKCTGIPYADKVPDIARAKSWTTVEINDWIHIWFHAEGLKPYWSIPEIEEITNGTLRYKGRTEHHINAHIEEVPENGADAAHLKQVHQPFLAGGYELEKMRTKWFSWIHHSWDANWSQLATPDGHIGCMEVTHDLKVFGFNFFRLFHLDVKAFQLGPAVVHITMVNPLFKCVLIHVVTPMEPMVQKIVQTLYVPWAMPNIIAKIFLASDGIQVDRDVSIWNNKKFQSKPMLSKSREDSLIARHRRWYSQFYSEHSPRLNFQKDTLDW